jgi:hypothetical protein
MYQYHRGNCLVCIFCFPPRAWITGVKRGLAVGTAKWADRMTVDALTRGKRKSPLSVTEFLEPVEPLEKKRGISQKRICQSSRYQNYSIISPYYTRSPRRRYVYKKICTYGPPQVITGWPTGP